MSGFPNKEQISRVILIGRTVNGLDDEMERTKKAVRVQQLRMQEIEHSRRLLTNERSELMRSMDVSPCQKDNYGYEQRHEAFLNLVASLNPIGIAEEPK